mgnify:CR=1 FL=1
MAKVAEILKLLLKQRNITKGIKNNIENLSSATLLHKICIKYHAIKKSVLKRLKTKVNKNENIYKRNSRNSGK